MRRLLLEALNRTYPRAPFKDPMKELLDRKCSNPECARCNYYANLAAKGYPPLGSLLPAKEVRP